MAGRLYKLNFKTIRIMRFYDRAQVALAKTMLRQVSLQDY
jgi:hypothetical protein